MERADSSRKPKVPKTVAVEGEATRYDAARMGADPGWFREARFGLFVHFGLSAVAGKEISWHMSRERIPSARWRAHLARFNPDRLDAREWARCARDVGPDARGLFPPEAVETLTAVGRARRGDSNRPDFW